MSEVMVLKAEKREAAGSAMARRLRRVGSLPAEVYGENGNRSIQVNSHAFGLMLKRHGEHQIMDLEIDGVMSGKVLIKAVQHDPLSGGIIHADFVQVSMTRKIQVSLPVRLTGEPAGTKAGGVLEQAILELDVECLPGDMVEEIRVDVSGLEVGHHLVVSDLALPSGLKARTDGNVVVASVVLLGLEKAEEATAEVAPAAGAKAPAAGAKAPAAGAKAPAAGAKAPAAGAKAPAKAKG